MSRSYRHAPVIVQAGGNRKATKRAAAKSVRRLALDEVSNGRVYARHFPQYDLREWSGYVPSGKSRLFRRQGGHRSELAFVPVSA